MGLHAGVDLHSNNGYYGIVDDQGERVFKKRLPNELPVILSTLQPFKEQLKAIAVESTYNWYWLVDGLMDHGYPVRLANPAKMEQYDGVKNADDENDAFFLAELLRLGILPEGYIYPKEERPVRDLLRRRMLLVHQRTAHLLSFQSLVMRETGVSVGSNQIKKLREEDVAGLLHDEYLALAGQMNLSVIRFLTEKIRDIEKAALSKIKLKPGYEKLLSVPGIGMILGLTIMLETGPIGRFATVGDYTSYCRCAHARRTPNGQKKGENNRKNGNRYLAWAYVEAANFAKRYLPEARSFYQRKKAKTNECVATKALASKLSKACYFILKDPGAFDKERMFG
jgi:transposase